ncbi:hypothetical protein [Lentzea sp. E54]|uniref:hypothetical protein n=1 Tax=Lentzea xerophila TaxID=3435883 RepID=UPI003DA30D8F
MHVPHPDAFAELRNPSLPLAHPSLRSCFPSEIPRNNFIDTVEFASVLADMDQAWNVVIKTTATMAACARDAHQNERASILRSQFIEAKNEYGMFQTRHAGKWDELQAARQACESAESSGDPRMIAARKGELEESKIRFLAAGRDADESRTRALRLKSEYEEVYPTNEGEAEQRYVDAHESLLENFGWLFPRTEAAITFREQLEGRIVEVLTSLPDIEASFRDVLRCLLDMSNAALAGREIHLTDLQRALEHTMTVLQRVDHGLDTSSVTEILTQTWQDAQLALQLAPNDEQFAPSDLIVEGQQVAVIFARSTELMSGVVERKITTWRDTGSQLVANLKSLQSRLRVSESNVELVRKVLSLPAEGNLGYAG